MQESVPFTVSPLGTQTRRQFFYRNLDFYARLCLLLFVYSQTTYNHGYTNLNRYIAFLDHRKHS